MIDDSVFYDVSSDHPAAGIIEYGGYSPFPPWGAESGLDFPVAKEIFKKQPFKQPRPFLRPAANNAVKKLNKEVVAQFKAAKP